MKVIMSIEARPGDEPAHDNMSTETPGPLWRRLAWFVGLWAMSVAVIAVVAYAIRSVVA
jgi:hypothetical protein